MQGIGVQLYKDQASSKTNPVIFHMWPMEGGGGGLNFVLFWLLQRRYHTIACTSFNCIIQDQC